MILLMLLMLKLSIIIIMLMMFMLPPLLLTMFILIILLLIPPLMIMLILLLMLLIMLIVGLTDTLSTQAKTNKITSTKLTKVINMNKQILMIMDSLANPNKYTIEQLRDNRDDAYNAYDAATYVIYSAATTDYNAAESAHNNNNVNAAYYAATAATALVYDAADTAYANYWLNSYFKQSGENKQDYIDEINKGYEHE